MFNHASFGGNKGHKEGDVITIHDKNGPLISRQVTRDSKTAINEHTGQLIYSTSSQLYRDNYDKIFGKNKQSADDVNENN